jgi:hypothetical protein
MHSPMPNLILNRCVLQEIKKTLEERAGMTSLLCSHFMHFIRIHTEGKEYANAIHMHMQVY